MQALLNKRLGTRSAAATGKVATATPTRENRLSRMKEREKTEKIKFRLLDFSSSKIKGAHVISSIFQQNLRDVVVDYTQKKKDEK